MQVVVIRPGAIKTEFGAGEAEGLREYADDHSPYRAQLERFIPWHKDLHPNAPGPIEVARAIQTAIVSGKPRPYYVVPATNHWIVLLQKLLPAARVDAFIERVVGLPRP